LPFVAVSATGAGAAAAAFVAFAGAATGATTAATGAVSVFFTERAVLEAGADIILEAEGTEEDILRRTY
jgi:hypothetical protein